MASSTGCGVVVSGTNCPKTWGTTAPSIGPSKDVKLVVSSKGFGPSFSAVAMSWAVWTGNGSLRTLLWVKPVWGGPDGPQPHGPGQGWDQAQSASRGRGRSLERNRGRSQRP